MHVQTREQCFCASLNARLLGPFLSGSRWGCILGSKSHKSFEHLWLSFTFYFSGQGKGLGYACGATTLLLQGIQFIFAGRLNVHVQLPKILQCASSQNVVLIESWHITPTLPFLPLQSAPILFLVDGLMSTISRDFIFCPSGGSCGLKKQVSLP